MSQKRLSSNLHFIVNKKANRQLDDLPCIFLGCTLHGTSNFDAADKTGFATASTSHRLPAPPTLALSELMKTQLDLTENFLRAQKRLYSSYCDSLQEAVMSEQQRRRHHRNTAGGGDKVGEYFLDLLPMTFLMVLEV